MSRRLMGCVLVVLVSVAGAALASNQTVGTATFAVPKGWTVRGGDAADHVAITKANTKQYCILSVWQPRAADASLAAAFASEWASTNAAAGAAPTPSTRKVGTRVVAEAGVQTTMEGTSVYAAAHVMLINAQDVTVVSYSTNEKALAWCRPDLDALLAGIQVAAPAADTAPAPAAPAGPAGTLHMTDLVGKWANGGAAVASYVDSSGNYSGTSTTFFGEWYTIKADGSYELSFQGRANNHTIRETGRGKISLSGDLVILEGTREGSKDLHRFHFISFQAASNGTAVLTLLDESYPVNAGNLGLYKEVWIKNPAAKK